MNKRKQQGIEARYRQNLCQLPHCTDYVYSQWADHVEKLAFGAKGHIGGQGCGAVAVHNAMKYSGHAQDFCNVLHDMETLNMTWLGAVFGTKPFSLGRYFRLHDVPYQKTPVTSRFIGALTEGRIGIVCTWNPKLHGMHFYCVMYSSQKNAYQSINYHSGGRSFANFDLNEISPLRFIIGYII